MNHSTTRQFWTHYSALPEHIQRLADKNFKILKGNPRHPSLHFKKIGTLWTVRIGLQYRALGFASDDQIIWFWIGSHADYDKLTP